MTEANMAPEEEKHLCPICGKEYKTEKNLLAHIVEKHSAAAEPAPVAPVVAEENDPKRPVRVKLYKDSGKYKEPLFVSVNDKRYLIPRGVDVTVPYYIALSIEESLAQDEKTATLISELVDSSKFA